MARVTPSYGDPTLDGGVDGGYSDVETPAMRRARLRASQSALGGDPTQNAGQEASNASVLSGNGQVEGNDYGTGVNLPNMRERADQAPLSEGVASAAPAPTVTLTPVQANGLIPPVSATPPPVVTATPPAAPKEGESFYPIPGGVWTGTGWVAAGSTPGATPGAGTPASQASVTQQQWNTLSELMANPSMTEAVIAALKEKQKETLLLQRQQALESLGQGAASRGMYDSNWLGAQQANLYDTTAGNLTGAYRDIDINAVMQNRKDVENALAAVNAALGTANQGRSIDNQYALGNRAIDQQAYEFGQTMPLNWFQALSGDQQWKSNYGLGAASLEQQAVRDFWDNFWRGISPA